MQSFFTSDFFAGNRAALRAAIKSNAPIILTGNGTMQKGGDEAFPFHQDSNFWYLTGLSTPDLVLVITTQETYLIAPTLSFEREAFDGAYDFAAFAATSGITQILDGTAGWKKVREELTQTHTAATPLSAPAYMKRHGLHTLPYRRRLVEKIKRLDHAVVLQDIRQEIAQLRCIKQPGELRALQRAIDITAATIADIRQPEFLNEVRHEYEIEAAISYGFRKRGADGPAFFSIVGAGKHSTTLHHQENDGEIMAGDLIVIDIGASVEHYAADITRTISNRPLKGRKAELWNAVSDVQKYALGHIKAGVNPLDYEKDIEIYMGTKLLELGVIKDATRENIRHYFPHATSHFLGLDLHDTGDYREPWQKNMVITCEPGIYIPEEGIGVRIEDDVLITETGNTVLSAACPREAA
ncbi:M24 family metallopeptidase [Candidatus Saccharibacteria bacterium]|nr:MAG: M24 family metallopeptidase [Candidatus Saccharibacteria bacterium]